MGELVEGEAPADGPSNSNVIGGTFSTFLDLLDSLDGKQYGAYHSIETTQGWVHDNFILRIKRAQSDPFASPTQCQIEVNAAFAQFPPALYANKVRSVALADYMHRTLHKKALEIGADAALAGKGWGGPKGGDIQILEPCQHVLEQSAVVVKNGTIVVQLTINLPARGRTILGRAAREIFGQTLSTLLQTTLKYELLSPSHIESHVNSVEDQVWLQRQLDRLGLVAFVRDGAILPRASGVDDRPLLGGISFESPPSMRLKFQLPSTGDTVTGMGFKKGISLISGGGFHGKSTLLEALQFGVYPKLPGDGREFCVTSLSATKIRAEDGRSVNAVDISPFISNLPFGKDTTCFHSLDASGSTSQASSIIEAIEMGTNLLLFDEDTCATNFMIRDKKMMQLVSADKEPITPFVHKVRSLFEDHSVSSILVIGGSGDYFSVADTVVMMDTYKCFDVTARAKEIAGPDQPLSLPLDVWSHGIPTVQCSRRRESGSTLHEKRIIW
ncbi:putative ATPase of the ABC class [Fragilaria crotonensis]|nr:putative ATPase of the ABC class [Fragilaria crotonensis]